MIEKTIAIEGDGMHKGEEVIISGEISKEEEKPWRITLEMMDTNYEGIRNHDQYHEDVDHEYNAKREAGDIFAGMNLEFRTVTDNTQEEEENREIGLDLF